MSRVFETYVGKKIRIYLPKAFVEDNGRLNYQY